ncbi:phosphate acyltransferase PlsX [Desulfoscipio gibsoniae]|uniref:Phosphate acyltransferase n=1 Tax=Desulfoscipio gibsoniae DSM 7213 TaxID=767817 RepID=R4KG56_9FIRM|nr:phosphate acyltransferase PlsX [Desulfoscipio gibsoniae]AGL02203.1 fatty acid/phospholipid synthesis protein PlsX [Desulfoscipio gibsoniae DSM 7213]
MKIAIDAMGGDYAPREIVRGAWEACRETGQQIIMVGDRKNLENELNQLGKTCAGLEIVHADEVITMDEAPVVAVRRKKNSSLVMAAELVRDGYASAFVSAGSTGATMAAALLRLGRIPGIARPAVAGVLPTERGVTILLDVGANVDCKPRHLVQFAIMGSLYAHRILGIENPRVGLLNVGEESTKGNELTQETYPLLQEAPVHFYGNVEGRDIFKGTVDVVVCDGFVGNVVLKTGEGLADVLMSMIGQAMRQSILAKAGAALTLPALKSLGKKINYSEYGGAPLLGINGVAIVCHGSSKSLAIKNAIYRARESVENGLISAISDSLNNTVHKVGFADGN